MMEMHEETRNSHLAMYSLTPDECNPKPTPSSQTHKSQIGTHAKYGFPMDFPSITATGALESYAPQSSARSYRTDSTQGS